MILHFAYVGTVMRYLKSRIRGPLGLNDFTIIFARSCTTSARPVRWSSILSTQEFAVYVEGRRKLLSFCRTSSL